jgi:hypothetical protein
MSPTAKLRFVERSQPDYPGANTGRVIRVLQQWWQGGLTMNLGWTNEVSIGDSKGEWRDVPLETE